MRFLLFSIMVVSGAAGIAFSSAACDDSTNEPGCGDAACALFPTDTGAPDAILVTPDDSSVAPLEPFDAGVPQPPPCAGLFELCSSTECCSPYGCTNGTCR